MNPTLTPPHVLAKMLLRTHDTANQARAALARLRAHLARQADYGGTTDTISMQLAASVAEFQAKRNACADMCLVIGASQAQVDLALRDDDDAFYDLYDAMRGRD